MNKPAAKEPSMDEILSSIRQIIADDDAAPAKAAPKPVESDHIPAFTGLESDDGGIDEIEATFAAAGEESSEEELIEQDPVEEEPLALSPDQIVPDEEAEEEQAEEEVVKQALAPDEEDDIAFSAEPEVVPQPRPAPKPKAASRPSVAQNAPMPDADLSADMAEKLLEPATDAMVRSTFAKLGSAVSLGAASNMTLEQMIKDMMRPMLKEWLDEHLPTMVERMVQAEIERVSRGQ